MIHYLNLCILCNLSDTQLIHDWFILHLQKNKLRKIIMKKTALLSVGAEARYEWTTDATFGGVDDDDLNNAKIFAKLGYSF